MMMFTRACILMLALVPRVVSQNTVWLQMSEAALNIVSTDFVRRQPGKVFDLSDLVMKTDQFEIYSVDVYTSGSVSSQMLLSQLRDGRFNGTWTAASIFVEVTGQATLMGRTFRVDSRVVISDAILRLTYQQDESPMLRLVGCDFQFQINSIEMKDSSLQLFVSLWRQQFESLPPQAICYRMNIVHNDNPLSLFGMPDPSSGSAMPTAVVLRDSNIWIAYQRRETELEVVNVGQLPVLQLDRQSSLTMYYPAGFLSYVIIPKIDDILQNQFVASSSARIKLTSLSEYFEMGGSTFEDKYGYNGVFSLEVRNHSLQVKPDGLVSSTVSTLRLTASSQCADYSLFSLYWKLDISYKFVYNDQTVYVRVRDVRSDVSLTESNIGQAKNLPKLMEDLQVKESLDVTENLSFFLENTAVLYNTDLLAQQNYLILRSDTNLTPRVTPWKEFGSEFSGDDVRVIGNRDVKVETIEFCENRRVVPRSGGSAHHYQGTGLLVIILASSFTLNIA